MQAAKIYVALPFYWLDFSPNSPTQHNTILFPVLGFALTMVCFKSNIFRCRGKRIITASEKVIYTVWSNFILESHKIRIH